MANKNKSWMGRGGRERKGVGSYAYAKRTRRFFIGQFSCHGLLLPVVILPVDNAVVITRRLQRGKDREWAVSARSWWFIYAIASRERKKKKRKNTGTLVSRPFTPSANNLSRIIYRIICFLHSLSFLPPLKFTIKNNNKSIRLNSVSSIDLPRRDTCNRGFWVKWRTVSKILNDFKIIY